MLLAQYEAVCAVAIVNTEEEKQSCQVAFVNRAISRLHKFTKLSDPLIKIPSTVADSYVNNNLDLCENDDNQCVY